MPDDNKDRGAGYEIGPEPALDPAYQGGPLNRIEDIRRPMPAQAPGEVPNAGGESTYGQLHNEGVIEGPPRPRDGLFDNAGRFSTTEGIRRMPPITAGNSAEALAEAGTGNGKFVGIEGPRADAAHALNDERRLASGAPAIAGNQVDNGSSITAGPPEFITPETAKIFPPTAGGPDNPGIGGGRPTTTGNETATPPTGSNNRLMDSIQSTPGGGIKTGGPTPAEAMGLVSGGTNTTGGFATAGQGYEISGGQNPNKLTLVGPESVVNPPTETTTTGGSVVDPTVGSGADRMGSQSFNVDPLIGSPDATRGRMLE